MTRASSGAGVGRRPNRSLAGVSGIVRIGERRQRLRIDRAAVLGVGRAGRAPARPPTMTIHPQPQRSDRSSCCVPSHASKRHWVKAALNGLAPLSRPTCISKECGHHVAADQDRRLADAAAPARLFGHPAGRGRARLGDLDRARGRAGRPQRQADRNRFLQRLGRRQAGARWPAGGALRSGAAARRRAGGVRRPAGAVLRLALSAAVPDRRRRARACCPTAGRCWRGRRSACRPIW